MPEPTAVLQALASLLRASRRATKASSELAEQTRAIAAYRRRFQTGYSATRHKALVKQRSRAANRVARRQRRVNRLRAS